jgi:hypothetical protein
VLGSLFAYDAVHLLRHGRRDVGGDGRPGLVLTALGVTVFIHLSCDWLRSTSLLPTPRAWFDVVVSLS